MSQDIVVYGISNCDTVKRARQWLRDQGVAHVFHDFKKQGVPQAPVKRWLERLGRDRLLNRKGTTWRKLDEATRAAATDDDAALALMLEHPSVIKRPIVEWVEGEVTLGFDIEEWQQRAARQ